MKPLPNYWPPSHRDTVPVYNIIGLLCADDAEGVDGGVGGREVGVLSWSSGEPARRALTARQKLTHTGEKKRKKMESHLRSAFRRTVEGPGTNTETTDNRTVKGFLDFWLLRLHRLCNRNQRRPTETLEQRLQHNRPGFYRRFGPDLAADVSNDLTLVTHWRFQSTETTVLHLSLWSATGSAPSSWRGAGHRPPQPHFHFSPASLSLTFTTGCQYWPENSDQFMGQRKKSVVECVCVCVLHWRWPAGVLARLPVVMSVLAAWHCSRVCRVLLSTGSNLIKWHFGGNQRVWSHGCTDLSGKYYTCSFWRQYTRHK